VVFTKVQFKIVETIPAAIPRMIMPAGLRAMAFPGVITALNMIHILGRYYLL